MSFPRNVSGFTTLDSLLVNHLEIQTQSENGFIIYQQSPANPLFSVNGKTGTITTNGSLNVLGSATFTEVIINENNNGLYGLASTNITSDTIDIGIYGHYNPGSGVEQVALARVASDPFQRWLFLKDLQGSTPLSNIPTYTSSNLAPIGCDKTYINNGTVSTPAYTFYSDRNTGIYYANTNSLGISSSSQHIIDFSYSTITSLSSINIDTTATIYSKLYGTTDDISSSASGITTGSLLLSGLNNADKWQRYITLSALPGYSGNVYSYGTSSHYFLTATSNGFLLSSSTQVLSPSTNPPDYRNGSLLSLFQFASTLHTTYNPIIYPVGSVSAPAITWAADNTTGIYRRVTGATTFTSSGSLVFEIASSYINSAQQIRNINGTVSIPAYSFTTTINTGIYRDNTLGNENISLALNGVLAGQFISPSGNNQLSLNIGSLLFPSLIFGTTNTGLYSASANLINIATAGQNVWIHGNRIGIVDTQCLNSVSIVPDGSVSVARISPTASTFTNALMTNGSAQGFNIVDPNVLLLYRFKSSGTLGMDSSTSISPINATVVGSPNWLSVLSDGLIIKKYILDLSLNGSPTNMYLNLTNSLSSFTSVGNFTISFWFYTSGSPSPNGTILNFNAGSKNISFRILNSSNNFEVLVQSNTLTDLQFNSINTTLGDSKWHHAVILLGSNGNKIYIDGVQLSVAGSTLNYTSIGNTISSGEYATNTLNNLSITRITIAGQYNGIVFSSPFTGYIYALYMTASNLSSTQITALYNEGSFSTYSLDTTLLSVGSFSVSQISATDGSVLSPSFSFANEIGLGWYRIGSGNIGLAISGANILDINSTRLNNAGIYYSSNGLVSAPAYSFTSDTSSGLYRVGSGSLSIAINSADKLLINSVIQIGSSSTDTTTKLYLPNATAANPALVWTSDTTTGWYRIGSGNLGLSSVGTLILDISSSRLYSVNPIYCASGTFSSPGLTFNSSSNTGLYYTATNNAINITNNGVLNATFENSGTPRLVLAVGSLSIPSLSFASNTGYGLYFASSALQISAASINVASFASSAITFNVPVNMTSSTFSAQYFQGANGSLSNPTFSFTLNPTTGFYLFSSNSVSLSSLGIETLRTYATLNSESATIIGNITNSSTNTGSNLLRFAGISGKQPTDYTVIAEKSYSGLGTNPTELLLFKGNSSGGATGQDRIRYRSYQHVFQVPSLTGEIYSTIGDNNTAMTIASANVIIGDTTAGSLSILTLPTGSVSAPSIAFIASVNTGLYYSATSNINVATGGSNIWRFSPSGTAHLCINPLTIQADGSTNSVLFTTTKTKATFTQTLLNNIPIVEYQFQNSSALATDSSINNYTGGINGSVSQNTSTITLTDTNGLGLLNYYALQLSFGTNGVFTSSVMSEMTNTNYINATIQIMVSSTSAGSTPANFFIIYGNSAVTTGNYIRLFMTSGGVLNVAYLSGNSTIISGTASAISVNTWYRIELVTTSAGNSLYVNGTLQTITYSTGSSATAFPISSSFTDKTAMRTYIGGTSLLNCPTGYIAYFGLIQTGSTDTVTTSYRQQIHELYTNKLVVSGLPYNLTSTSLNEGFLAISNKIGQIQWSNTLQIFPNYISVSAVLRCTNGSVSNPAYSFSSETNSGLYRIGSGNLAISILGSNILEFNGTSSYIQASQPIKINSASNQLVFNNTANTATINVIAPASSRIYTVLDAGSNSNFIMSAGSTSQSISSGLTLSGLTQFQAGINYNTTVSNSATINLTSDTSSHVLVLSNSSPTITLPTGSGFNGRELIFYYTGTPGVFTINTSGSDNIGNSGTNISFTTQYMTVRLIYVFAITSWLIL